MGFTVSRLAGLGGKIRSLFTGRTPTRGQAVLASAENRPRTDRFAGWYDFLDVEARGPEGLLCFYDRPRSPRVDCCSLDFVAVDTHHIM